MLYNIPKNRHKLISIKIFNATAALTALITASCTLSHLDAIPVPIEQKEAKQQQKIFTYLESVKGYRRITYNNKEHLLSPPSKCTTQISFLIKEQTPTYIVSTRGPIISKPQVHKQAVKDLMDVIETQ